MVRLRTFMPSRSLAFVGLSLIPLTPFLLSSSQGRRAEERASLIFSIVSEFRQEFQAAGKYVPNEAFLRAQKEWPDDFLALQSWLVFNTLQGQSPKEMSNRFDGLIQGQTYHASPVLKTSLNRWQATLTRWALDWVDPGILSSSELINVARQRYFEASGYQKIGRQYDATVLYLWVITLTQAFLEQSPVDQEAAEGLYLLGNSYFRLRYALPLGVRGDRLLNLCSEIYPDSIWAHQADALWRSEMRNGI